MHHNKRSLLTTVKNSPACCNHRKPAHNNEDPAWPTIKKYLKNKENHSYPLGGWNIYIYCSSIQTQHSECGETPEEGCPTQTEGPTTQGVTEEGPSEHVLLDKKEFVGQRGVKQALLAKAPRRGRRGSVKQHGLLRE